MGGDTADSGTRGSKTVNYLGTLLCNERDIVRQTAIMRWCRGTDKSHEEPEA
jgi:hypothetical protein